MKYDFEYSDSEGDVYQSDTFNSKREALESFREVQKMDDCARITDSWVYDEDNNFVKRWY